MTTGVIATPHFLATEAGAQMLRDGGNAIDAVIAADAVLCVVYPQMTSVAGDLMANLSPGVAPAFGFQTHVLIQPRGIPNSERHVLIQTCGIPQ